MANVLALTDSTINEVELQPGLTLIDFGAAWCGPCRMMAPVVEQLAAENAGRITVATVDTDANAATAARYGVRSLPTFVFLRDGEVVDTIVGAVAKVRLQLKIDEHAPAQSSAS
jgi:thioredoxin 1